MKRYVIVTLILQHPVFDYSRMMGYVRQFDWLEAVAPTATNKSVLLFTDKPEREIRETIAGLIGPQDFVSVCSYDDVNGSAEIQDQAKAVAAWVSSR